jgi:hypothetical protein
MRRVTRNSHRWMVYICNGINVVYNIFLIFAAIFRCKPISYFWVVVENQNALGSCSPGLALRATYLQSGIGAAIDITFSTLPWWILRDSGMSNREKIAQGGVLVLSYL